MRRRTPRLRRLVAAVTAGVALCAVPGTAQAAPATGDLACLAEEYVPVSGVALSALPFDIARTGTGTAVHAFGTGTDGQVWTRPIAGGGAGWSSLGGVSLYGPAATFAGTANHVAVIGGDGAVWIRVNAGSGWGGWSSLGGYFVGSPAIASLGAGHLRVFGAGADGALWTNEYASSRWSGWYSLGGQLAAPPVATTYPAYGQIEVSVMGLDGLVWTMGLGQGWRSGQWIDRQFAACSTLSVPSVSRAAFPGNRAFLDSDWSLRHHVPTTSGTSYNDLGGVFDANPDIEHNGLDWNSVTIAGIGADGGLWVSDPRLGSGFFPYGGQFL